jgi:hypothetical protein
MVIFFYFTFAIDVSNKFSFLMASSFFFGLGVPSPSESLSDEPSCFELQNSVGVNLWK